MENLKIIEHTFCTYETSDGREFEDKQEAMEWQKHLSTIENTVLLNIDYKPTTDYESVMYVHVKTQEQVEAFNAMQQDLDLYARLDEPGYYRYNQISDSYNDIEDEIESLQQIIDKLKGSEN